MRATYKHLKLKKTTPHHTDWQETQTQSRGKTIESEVTNEAFTGWILLKLMSDVIQHGCCVFKGSLSHTYQCVSVMQCVVTVCCYSVPSARPGETGGPGSVELPQASPAAAPRLALSLVSLSADAARQPICFYSSFSNICASRTYMTGPACKHTEGHVSTVAATHSPCVRQSSEALSTSGRKLTFWGA